MEKFYYSQKITADDVNGIAVDLGAQSFSHFENGVPYAVDQLNEITKALASKGITSNGNKFQVSVTNGNVVIGTGIGIFESGKKVVLKSSLTLPYKQGELYFENDETANMVSAKIGTLPSNDYIHIATLNTDGTVTDRRAIAIAKIETFTAVNGWNATQAIDFEQSFTCEVPNKKTRFSLDINGDDFKYIIFSVTGLKNLSEINRPEKKIMSVLNVKTGISECVRYYADQSTHDEISTVVDDSGLLYSYDLHGSMGGHTTYQLRFVSFEFGKINLEIESTNYQSVSGTYGGSGSIAGTLILC